MIEDKEQRGSEGGREGEGLVRHRARTRGLEEVGEGRAEGGETVEEHANERGRRERGGGGGGEWVGGWVEVEEKGGRRLSERGARRKGNGDVGESIESGKGKGVAAHSRADEGRNTENARCSEKMELIC